MTREELSTVSNLLILKHVLRHWMAVKSTRTVRWSGFETFNRRLLVAEVLYLVIILASWLRQAILRIGKAP